MNTINPRRFLLAVPVLFFTAMVWNAFWHLLVIASINEAVSDLGREPTTQVAILSIILTLGLVLLFLWGYCRFVHRGSLREALLYALFFALLAGLLVDLNQYIGYPLTVVAPLLWFVGGLVEFTLYALVLHWLKPCHFPMQK